jgi:hypothetical protein
VNARTEQVDDLQLVALPSAVNCAELFARFSLAEWSLRPMQDEAAHVLGNLVASVVDTANHRVPRFITLRLRLSGNMLILEVEIDPYAPKPAPTNALKGRHAGILQLDDGCTLLWCEMPLPTGMTASAVPLPRREPRRSPAAEGLPPEATEVDPQVMERLLYGLGGSQGWQAD